MTANCQCNMQYIPYKERELNKKQENIIIKIKK